LLKLFQAFTYARSPSLPRVKRRAAQETQMMVDFVLRALGTQQLRAAEKRRPSRKARR
jgi:hypothetical protein